MVEAEDKGLPLVRPRPRFSAVWAGATYLWRGSALVDCPPAHWPLPGDLSAAPATSDPTSRSVFLFLSVLLREKEDPGKELRPLFRAG